MLLRYNAISDSPVYSIMVLPALTLEYNYVTRLANNNSYYLFSYSRYSERDSHRSEGEYEEERYVDRKEYDGKWADGNEPERPPAEEKPAEQPPKE